MPKSVTIYREVNGQVEKIEVSEAPLRGGLEAVNYHENIIRTYHELECQGKLGDMSPRTKQFVRDVHTHAQNPAYWPSSYTKEERGI